MTSMSRAAVVASRARSAASESSAGQQDGVAAQLDRVDAGQGGERGRVGAGQRGPDGPAGRRRDLICGGGAVGDDRAGAHEHDPVGVRVGLVQVVGGEQDGAALLGLLPHRGPERAPGLDVQAGGGLVEHDQVGVGDQRHGEPDPLLLAAGEAADPPLGELGRRRPGRAPRGTGRGARRSDGDQA